MPNPLDTLVDPTDEGRHVPEADPLWNESVYLDFVADGGSLAGYARIGLYPNLGVTWWTTMLVGRDRPTVASVDYLLPQPAEGVFALSSDTYDLTCGIEDPLKTVRLQASAPASSHDNPGEIFRGEPGRPTDINLDLTWHSDGVPYGYPGVTRYEVPCLVSGDVTVGNEKVSVSCQGQRDHSWGVRDWWAFNWCWAAARLDDGTRIHFTDVRIPGMRTAFGYIQDNGNVATVKDLEVTEELGPEGMPNSSVALVGSEGLRVDIEPIAFGPVVLSSADGRVSRFPRAAARFTTNDGRAGLGWIEWNQVQPADG